MISFLTRWFLQTKLEVTLEEAERLHSVVLDLRNLGLAEVSCSSLLTHVSLDYLKQLECLMLQRNGITEFNRVLCYSLENLKALTLDYNRLEDLPFDMRNLKSLSMLNISHNEFVGMHFFYVVCQLETLKVLWADATGITEIPREIKNLKRLQTLGLRRNHIRQLPKELFILTKLRWLTLAGNKIEEIPAEIIDLTFLVHLNLERNRLTSLPPLLAYMRDLQYLYVQGNRLTIDREFLAYLYQFPKIRRCRFAGNRPSTIPDPVNPRYYAQIEEVVRSETNGLSTVMTPWSVSAESQNSPEVSNVNIAYLPSINSVNAESTVGRRAQDQPAVAPHWQHMSEELVPEDPSEMGTDDDLRTVYRKLSRFPESSGPSVDDSRGTFENDELASAFATFPNESPDVDVVIMETGARQFATSSKSLMDLNNTLDETTEDHFKRAQVVKQVVSQSTSHQPVPSDTCATIHNCHAVVVPSSKSEGLLFSTETSEKLQTDDIDNLNGNFGSSVRMIRTREWVSAQETSSVTATGCHASSLRDLVDNTDHHDETNQSCIKQIGVDELSQIRGAVDSIIATAIQVVGSDYIVDSPPLPSRQPTRSEIWISASRATCHCRPTSSGAISLEHPTMSPSEQQNIDGSQAQEGVSESERSASLKTVWEDMVEVGINTDINVENATSYHPIINSSSQLFPVESNYDHSDWEHSAPSSAIDEQEFVTRFPVHDQEEQEGGPLDDDLISRLLFYVL